MKKSSAISFIIGLIIGGLSVGIYMNMFSINGESIETAILKTIRTQTAIELDTSSGVTGPNM